MNELGNEQNTEMKIDEPTQIDGYFSVSTVKFILMCLGTLGLYNLYWHYRNWQYLKLSKSLDIMPFWRAFFAPLWVFSLFNYLYESASAHGIKTKIPPMLLASVYFIISALWRLPDPYWIVSFLAVIPLLVANSVAVEVNRKNQSFKQNSSLAIWQWVIVAVSGSILSLVTYIAVSGDSVEGFTFRSTLQHDLIAKCGNDDACRSSVESQIKPCLEKSNWRSFLEHQDDETELHRFTSEFYGCIVDDDGNVYFKSN